MYSDNFRKWLFNYLDTGDVKKASGAKKEVLLQKMLDACNYCENEAGPGDLRWICRHVEKFGLSQTRHIVAQSKNVTADLQQALSPAATKKVAKKNVGSGPAASRNQGSVFSQATPIDYMVASANTQEGLEFQVRDLLRAGGWHLSGGISVAVRHQPRVEVLFSQALFRY